MWEALFFWGFGGLAAVMAVLVIAMKNPIHSALALIGNMFCLAALFALLDAHFLAAIQVLVYAGAILVLFLFVIMLLGADQLGQSETLGWQRPVALLLGLVLLVETGYVLFTQAGQIDVAAALPDGFGSPFEVGKLLFNQYLLPFEVTSVLLLVAMIGAIVLTRQEKKK